MQVTVENLGVGGPLLRLLCRTIMPNLAHTTEGQPAFIHAGPFGNIDLGCSSIIADRLAHTYANYAVTKAGFGSVRGL